MHPTAIDLLFSSDPSTDSMITYDSAATSMPLKNVLDTVDSFSVRWDLKYSNPDAAVGAKEDDIENYVRDVINNERKNQNKASVVQLKQIE